MRRLLPVLLFPLLLIAQQGGLVHELEHFAAAVSSRSSEEPKGPNSQFCEKCFTFAHIGAAADVAILHFAAAACAFAAINLRLPLPASVQAELARNRGPPASL